MELILFFLIHFLSNTVINTNECANSIAIKETKNLSE